MDDDRFERLVLPHLDAAYNLARWLAHDVLRAMRYFGSFRGDQGRPWLLQIVRHTCWSWLADNRPGDVVAFDDTDEDMAPSSDEPQANALRNADRAQVNQAIAALPVPLREVLVLRDLEDLSYKDIARIADIPIGTVMSRLSRARAQMREALRPGARPVLRPVGRSGRGGGL